MQEKKRKATIKDVAARANTSITTVSRVLSGRSIHHQPLLQPADSSRPEGMHGQ